MRAYFSVLLKNKSACILVLLEYEMEDFLGYRDKQAQNNDCHYLR